MTRMDRMWLTLVAVFALTLGLSGGAAAQKGDVQDNQQQSSDKGGTVTKTFELTINGVVQEPNDVDRTNFYVVYGEDLRDPDESEFFLFCGGTQGESKPDCEGDGAVYRHTAEFPAGTTIEFRFARGSTVDVGTEDPALGPFFSGTETLDADLTNTAFYNFGDAKGGTGQGNVQDDQQDDDGAGHTQDDQQEMPGLPATGAGGAAGGIPAGVLAGALSLACLGVLSTRVR